MRAQILELSLADDPKKYIFDAVGDLAKRRTMLGDRVLIATYIRPNKTRGGIILTDKALDEDRYQSKVGLILAMGPIAFKYQGGYEYEGAKPQIGDWVQIDPSMGREFFLGARDLDSGGIPCRHISSENVQAVIENPGAVF